VPIFTEVSNPDASVCCQYGIDIPDDDLRIACNSTETYSWLASADDPAVCILVVDTLDSTGQVASEFSVTIMPEASVCCQ